MTKLIGLARAKNEADFIEYFARHNLQILDQLYIADDRSTDNTVEIVNSLSQEGLPIEIEQISDRNIRLLNLQDQAMTQLMRYAAAKQGRNECHFFALDADEILLGRREDVLSQVRGLAPYEYGLIKWRTFAPINGGIKSNQPLHNSFRPLLMEQSVYYKVVVPIKHAGSVSITMGNHDINPQSAKLKPRKLDVDLAHFPVRSAEQIISKALIASHKTHLKKTAGSGEAYHIITLANQIRALNYSLQDHELTGIVLNYLQCGDKGELANDFNMEAAFLPITPIYQARRVNPIGALDELLQDIILAESVR